MVEELQAVAEDTLDMAPLDDVLEQYTAAKGVLIAVLQQAQGIYGYLPHEVLQHISRKLRVPFSQIYGVATFYSQFYLQKRGRNIVRVCDGTACHVRGAAKIVSALEKDVGIQAGETTSDYRVSLEVVYCLGSCGLSPVAVINERVIGRLIPEKAIELVRELQ
ncbi:MAG TPA: NAD(P)H-dependent oxidoreductase subunit E [Anaerolineae bacterium]|nr:NAD(P)H-dependent oxidoreductase subunit E [Anaerolineae bacterium]